MADYILSKRAQHDLATALRWSLREAGAAQTARYDRQLRSALASLVAPAESGTPSGLYASQSGSHLIFFRMQPRQKRARVVRILHSARLPELDLIQDSE